MEANESLKFWKAYEVNHEPILLVQYLESLIQKNKECLEKSYSYIGEHSSLDGPHLFSLPENLLRACEKILKAGSLKNENISSGFVAQQIQPIVIASTIICRNFDNIPFVSSCDIVSHVVAIASSIVIKLVQCKPTADEAEKLNTFLAHTFHFLEVLYDPYRTWIAVQEKKPVNRTLLLQFRPSVLHVEVIPFFYDFYHQQAVVLPVHLQTHLLKVFGSILSGAQHNALSAVTPATLQVLFQLLTDVEYCHDSKLVSLQCISYSLHIINRCSPEQRQIEVSTVMENYTKTIVQLTGGTDAGSHLSTVVSMLDTMQDMLCSKDELSIRKVFQDQECLKILLNLLRSNQLCLQDKQQLAISVLDTLTVFISRGNWAKKHFLCLIGFDTLCKMIKSIESPSKDLILAVLRLAAECKSKNFRSIRNAQLAVSLLTWLPDIGLSDIQVWTVEQLLSLCESDLRSQITCCQSGMVRTVLRVLEKHSQLGGRTIGKLLRILEILGSHSLSPAELKQIFLMLRIDADCRQFAYTVPVIHTLSTMTKKHGWTGADHFFDFHDKHNGIAIHSIRKWPGIGFSFHAWLRLDRQEESQENDPIKNRRQLYSFLNTNGGGFEAFFTDDLVPVVATASKKEYCAAAVSDCKLDDGNWHCVSICHSASRRPFTQSMLTVYVDGRQRLSAQLKFPSVSEPLTYCRVGVGGQRTNLASHRYSDAGDQTDRSSSGGLIQTIGDTAMGQLSTLIDKEKLFALGSRTLPHALRGAFQQSPDPAIQTCANGGQDALWGSPHCIQGQIGSVCVFHEALTYTQIVDLYSLGPNCTSLYMLHDAFDLSDVLSKLVFYWDAKAYADETCMDLSEQHMYDGQVSGRCCKTLSVKDSINCLGGIPALYPLLENANRAANDKSEDFGGLTPQKPQSTTPQTPEDFNDEWVVLPTSSYSEWRLEQNQVAAFFLLVLHMLQGHPGNQEQLLSRNGFFTMNALLQKIPPELVDVNLLMATQLLVEGTAGNSVGLLRSVYHYILFDFRIWSKGSFPVRIGHIQYLSTVVKDDRKFFRKKYGPQFFLDSIQMFYSSCDLLNSDDVKTIRISLLGLIKYYLAREVNFQEVQAVIGFLITVKEEELLQEILEMILSLLDSPTAKDQLYLLLYEPGGAELLYCLLLNSNFSTLLKATILKVISVLLKTDRVYDKSKIRLRLHDLGFNCLTNLLSPSHISPEMVTLLMDQTLMIDNAASYQAALSMLHFIRHLDVSMKLDAVKKFLSVLKERNNVIGIITKQVGWQECVLSVLIRHAIAGKPVPVTPIPSLDLIDLSTEALEFDDEIKPESPMLGLNTTRRLSRKFSGSQRSLEEANLSQLPPRTPQFLLQLKEHIFDFDFPNILGRSRSGSQSSSVEDLSTGPQDTSARSRQNSGSISQPPAEVERCLVFLPDDGYSEKAMQRQPGQQLAVQSEEDLFEAVTEATFLLLWRGVEGSSKQAWQERGMVFACINLLALSNELFKSHLEIKRRILELALQACLADLIEAGQANVTHSENAIKLMEIVYDFIVLENVDDPRRISVRLLEEILLILDVLLVFEESPGQDGWLEMAEMGLGIVLVCAGTENLELCAMATAKLHALVQTRPFASLEEACHLLVTLDNILTKTLEVGDQEHYSFLIPVVRALLEKIAAPLHLKRHLPSLQLKAPGPAFFEDFQQYALNLEWKTFIEKVVRPLQKKYTILQVDKQRENMNSYWNQCYEATMITLHKRRREMGESKLKFQSQIGEVFRAKVVEEQSRYQAILAAQKHKLIIARKRWRMLKLYLYGPRGPWESRSPIVQHWKLSPHENLQRMRLKLTFNFTFDQHYQASRLRDNQGLASSMQPSSLGSLPPVAREARVAEQQEDSLREEDLQASTAAEVEGLEVSEKEKTVISEDCEIVTLMTVVKGRFEVSTNNIYFLDLSPLKEESERQDFKWPLSQLREVHLRRYNLRRSALEFFLVNQTNFFLNFTTKTRNKIYIRILGLRPQNLQYIHGIRSPAHLLRASGLTQKWVHREISNFEYLMQLNTIAGRTYNDLSQYPVFPWILSDYVSEELDLDDPAVYRDLSKPIGVVNPKNVADVKAKYDNFVDITGTVEKFHYGTHYSNSAGVLHYLVRLEPFTSLHVELQSNRFDVADRQFHSLEATWRMLMESCNDVKELIPEFFFLPEFLINMNGFDLGRLQGTKEMVDSVKLPPWASSPEEFIYKHRKALESEFVSSHLHEWIDLIFGMKQKGPAAVDALNVFYYVSYEGAVDLDAIEDPGERDATEGMINNFGQTPCQLLKELHPKRMAYEEAMFRLSKNETKQLCIFTFFQNVRTFFVEVSATTSPVVLIRLARNGPKSYRPYTSLETLVTVCQNGILGVHGWLPYDKTRTIQNYYTFERDPSHVNLSRTLRKLGAPFYPDLIVSHKLFVLTPDGKLLISGGHWDKSLKFYSLSKNRTTVSIRKHSDVITCLALDHFGGHLISGSRDTTCIIWELCQEHGMVMPKKMHVLCGHDDEVSCVAISMELHMAISGSKDGTVNIHTVQDGYFMRTLSPPCNNPQNQEISLLGLSSMGYICLYCQPKEEDKGGEHCLHLYSINGKHLYHRTIAGSLTDLYISGDYMVTGSYDGVVTIYELFGLQSMTSIPLHIPVMAVCVTHPASHILASLDDGKMIIIGVNKPTPHK